MLANEKDEVLLNIIYPRLPQRIYPHGVINKRDFFNQHSLSDQLSKSSFPPPLPSNAEFSVFLGFTASTRHHAQMVVGHPAGTIHLPAVVTSTAQLREVSGIMSNLP